MGFWDYYRDHRGPFPHSLRRTRESSAGFLGQLLGLLIWGSGFLVRALLKASTGLEGSVWRV